MRSLVKPFVVWSLVFCLTAVVAAPGLAAERREPLKDVSAGEMAVDLLVLRPLGMAATLVGGALCFLSIPFASAGGNQEVANRKLMVDPAKFTFQRQLGDI